MKTQDAYHTLNSLLMFLINTMFVLLILSVRSNIIQGTPSSVKEWLWIIVLVIGCILEIINFVRIRKVYRELTGKG